MFFEWVFFHHSQSIIEIKLILFSCFSLNQADFHVQYFWGQTYVHTEKNTHKFKNMHILPIFFLVFMDLHSHPCIYSVCKEEILSQKAVKVN